LPGQEERPCRMRGLSGPTERKGAMRNASPSCPVLGLGIRGPSVALRARWVEMGIGAECRPWADRAAWVCASFLLEPPPEG
jgi:hypothetical protein